MNSNFNTIFHGVATREKKRCQAQKHTHRIAIAVSKQKLKDRLATCSSTPTKDPSFLVLRRAFWSVLSALTINKHEVLGVPKKYSLSGPRTVIICQGYYSLTKLTESVSSAYRQESASGLTGPLECKDSKAASRC